MPAKEVCSWMDSVVDDGQYGARHPREVIVSVDDTVSQCDVCRVHGRLGCCMVIVPFMDDSVFHNGVRCFTKVCP